MMSCCVERERECVCVFVCVARTRMALSDAAAVDVMRFAGLQERLNDEQKRFGGKYCERLEPYIWVGGKKRALFLSPLGLRFSTWTTTTSTTPNLFCDCAPIWAPSVDASWTNVVDHDRQIHPSLVSIHARQAHAIGRQSGAQAYHLNHSSASFKKQDTHLHSKPLSSSSRDGFELLKPHKKTPFEAPSAMSSKKASEVLPPPAPPISVKPSDESVRELCPTCPLCLSIMSKTKKSSPMGRNAQQSKPAAKPSSGGAVSAEGELDVDKPDPKVIDMMTLGQLLEM